MYGGASGFGLLKRLIACGELKVEGKRNRSMTADANAAARTDPISVGRRLLRGEGMSREGWMIILLAGLIYAGIAGVFAWAGYMITGLFVFNFGLLVLTFLIRRAIDAQPLEFTDAPLYFDSALPNSDH